MQIVISYLQAILLNKFLVHCEDVLLDIESFGQLGAEMSDGDVSHN